MSEFFTEHTFSFLEELARNNNRDWFTANMARYERDVREPALAFIRAIQPRLAAFAPHFVADDRKQGGSLMRIHRDTRFSRDKHPYKTNIGIQFRHEAGKDVHAPGFYFHIEAHEVFVGAGIWHPDSETLAKIRGFIDNVPQDWRRARDDEGFRRIYTLTGDALKRPPKGFDESHPQIEDIKRKDFIGIAPLLPELLLQNDLTGRIANQFSAAVPFMKQLCHAVGLPY